jgi:hypothetical protein
MILGRSPLATVPTYFAFYAYDFEILCWGSWTGRFSRPVVPIGRSSGTDRIVEELLRIFAAHQRSAAEFNSWQRAGL